MAFQAASKYVLKFFEDSRTPGTFWEERFTTPPGEWLFTRGSLVDRDEPQVCFQDAGGMPSDLLHNGEAPIYPTVVITVRGPKDDYEAAEEIALAVDKALQRAYFPARSIPDGVDEEFGKQVIFNAMGGRSPMAYIGRTERDEHEFSGEVTLGIGGRN